MRLGCFGSFRVGRDCLFTFGAFRVLACHDIFLTSAFVGSILMMSCGTTLLGAILLLLATRARSLGSLLAGTKGSNAQQELLLSFGDFAGGRHLRRCLLGRLLALGRDGFRRPLLVDGFRLGVVGNHSQGCLAPNFFSIFAKEANVAGWGNRLAAS